MDVIQEKSHKYSEGWSENELQAKQKLSTKLTILALLLSIVLIVISIVFFNHYSITLMCLVLFSGIFSLILCGLIFYWFNSTEVVEKVEYQFQHQVLEVDQRFSVVVFLGSFINILFNCFLLVIIFFWYRIGKDFFIARNLESSPDSYMSDYNVGLYTSLPLLIIISLILMYVAFTSYITILQKFQLRVCVYFFSLSTILIAAFALSYVNQTVTDLQTPFSPIQTNFSFTIFQILAVGIIITAIVAFIVTFTYRHEYFETIGYFNLLIIFLISACSFHVIRQSEETRQTYIDQCGQQMRNTHEDWIRENATCDKYLSTSVCDPENFSVYWEKDNTQKCLNTSCCNAFSDSMSKNIFFSGFLILLLVISGYALSMSLLQVDTSVKTQQLPNRGLDWFMVLLAVVVIVCSMLLIFSTQSIFPQRDNIIVANQQTIKANKNPLVYPTGIENVTGCEPFMKVYKRLNKDQDVKLEEQSRVTILATKSQLVVTQYVNSKTVSYIPKLMIKNILYPSASDSTDGLFGVEGSQKDIQNILENHIQVCSEGEKKLQVDVYNLKEESKTRLLWQKHKIHEEERSQKFTSEQKGIIDNLQFNNLKIEIVDIQNGNNLSDVVIYFYKNDGDCGKIKPIPQRMITVDEETTLYNMVYKQYYFGAEKKGYYLYCNKFTNNEATKSLHITMIPRSTEKGQFTVVLETPKNEKFNMLLGASYPECTVGFFNDNCGGMQFYGDKNAQSIQINQLAQRKYTFFVLFDPKDQKAKDQNILKQEGKTIDKSVINNDPIFQELKPIVTLYAQEQERPIIRYQLPQSTNLKQEPNLTWIVLCVDGSIGDISQSSPAQFWSYQDEPNQYQRKSDSKDIYPKVCNNL